MKEYVLSPNRRMTFAASSRVALSYLLCALATVLFASRALSAEGLPVEIVTPSGHSARVNSVAFSPNGKLVLSASADKTIKLWDVSSGQLIRTFFGHTAPVQAVVFSLNGNMAVSVADDNTVRFWNLENGRSLKVSKCICSSLALSPDGQSLVTAGWVSRDGAYGSGVIQLWDVGSGRQIWKKAFDNEVIGSPAFSPDGRLIGLASGGNIKLLETGSGNLVRSINAVAVNVQAVAFSPDGRSILSGAEGLGHVGQIKLWQVARGMLQREFASHYWVTDSVTFSPDGRLAIEAAATEVTIWDVQSGKKIGVLIAQGDDTDVTSVAVSPDGQFVVSASVDGVVRLWGLKNRRLLHAMGQSLFNSSIESLAVSADRRLLLAGRGGGETEVWDAESGRLLHSFEGQGPIGAVAFSADGKLTLSGGNKTLDLRNTDNGGLVRKFVGHDREVTAAIFSKDSLLALSGGYDGIVRLWEVQTGRLLRTFSTLRPDNSGLGSWVKYVAFSADERLVIARSQDNGFFVWDRDSGRQIWTFGRAYGNDDVKGGAIGLSPDGKGLLQYYSDGRSDRRYISLLDVAGRRLVRNFEPGDVGVQSRNAYTFFLPDGHRALSPGVDGSLVLWDMTTGRPIHSIEGGETWAGNDEWVLAGHKDGTIKIFNTESGEPLASLFSLPDGEWLAVTPEGFFTGSENGAKSLTVVRGLEVYSIDQFKQELYRPDLVREKLAGDPQGKVRKAAARLDLGKAIASGNAPSLKITTPSAGSVVNDERASFTATITEQGGGIGRIEWRVNDVTLGVEARGFQRVEDQQAPAIGNAQGTMTVSRTLPLQPGKNRIVVVAYNAAGLIASNPAEITVSRDSGSSSAARPRLFVLAAGVNNYADGRLKLNYAVSDTQAVASAFQTAGDGLYESINVTTLTDADVTMDRLEKAFGQLASEVKPTDVFVLFVAGHGRTKDGHYYFVPQEFRYQDETSYAQGAVSQEQWQKWISAIPANKSVLIYDTCESGSLTAPNGFGARGNLSFIEEQVAAVDKLKLATGRAVMVAAGETQPALEGYRGHGLFSYAVLEGLGKAAVDKDGLIDLFELMTFVDKEVPKLSDEAFKQSQQPLTKFAGLNFPLVKPVMVFADVPQTGLNISTKPTHVVISATSVLQSADATAPAVMDLAPGTQVTLVETTGGWVLVARSGKKLGYVQQSTLLTLQ
jgi:WD40 repeat protein/uncharacterized caspase-like protein